MNSLSNLTPFSDKSKRELRESIRYMRKFSWSGPAVRVAEKLRKSYEKELASRKEGGGMKPERIQPAVPSMQQVAAAAEQARAAMFFEHAMKVADDIAVAAAGRPDYAVFLTLIARRLDTIATLNTVVES